LGNEQFLGSSAERAGVGHGQQVFQVLDIHRGWLSIFMRKMNDNEKNKSLDTLISANYDVYQPPQ
jgi:hypothetical protein